MMPDLDGPATFAELRKNPATADIPVVFLTAKVHSSERGRFIELGAAGVLAKPFDPMKLADDVAQLLGWTD
jgi:CheY-like chemotaxis protein